MAGTDGDPFTVEETSAVGFEPDTVSPAVHFRRGLWGYVYGEGVGSFTSPLYGTPVQRQSQEGDNLAANLTQRRRGLAR